MRYLILALLAILPAISGAQLASSWPDYAPDQRQYSSAFECLAMAQRVRASSERRLLWMDTAQQTPELTRARLPEETIKFSDLCIQQLTVVSDSADSARLLLEQEKYYRIWIPLLLIADRDREAERLGERIADTGSSGGVKILIPGVDSLPGYNPMTLMRAERLMNLVVSYIAVQPPRLSQANKYARMLYDLGSAVPANYRIESAARLFDRARSVDDTAIAKEAAEWILSISDGEEFESSVYARQFQRNILAARRFLTWDEALDNLRKSTADFINFVKKARWETSAMDRSMGKPVPPVRGDYWFSEPSDSILPRKGKVTLVLAEEYRGRVFALSAMLRRIKERFPEIDIIYATRTVGYFGMINPPEIAEEAEYRRRFIQDFIEVPAIVAVEATSFWRLPDPDRRRINEPTDNERFYAGRIMLVDRERILIYEEVPEDTKEEDLVELIEAMM